VLNKEVGFQIEILRLLEVWGVTRKNYGDNSKWHSTQLYKLF